MTFLQLNQFCLTWHLSWIFLKLWQRRYSHSMSPVLPLEDYHPPMCITWSIVIPTSIDKWTFNHNFNRYNLDTLKRIYRIFRHSEDWCWCCFVKFFYTALTVCWIPFFGEEYWYRSDVPWWLIAGSEEVLRSPKDTSW